MNEEKVLAYLNIEKDKKNDKFASKIVLGFNIGFTLFVGAMLLLMSFSQIHIALTISFFAIDLLFFICLIAYKNPAWQFIIEAIGLLLITIKLLIGYVISSKELLAKEGFPIFSWVHLTVLFLSLWVAIYLVIRLHRTYQIIKKHPIPIARKKIKRQSSFPKWLAVVIAFMCLPMLFVKLFPEISQTLGLGLGFACWTLACIFFILFAMYLPKVIVSIRFKAYRYFKP